MESRKYDVFVSYSRKDAEIVDRICQLMKQKQIVPVGGINLVHT